MFRACCTAQYWVGRAVICGDVQAPGTVLKERERVQALAEHRVEMERVDGDDALGLGREELTPGRAGAARDGVDARRVEDLPHRGCGDRVPEAGQLTLDPLVAPPSVFPSQA